MTEWFEQWFGEEYHVLEEGRYVVKEIELGTRA
jgi:hypothetical protein